MSVHLFLFPYRTQSRISSVYYIKIEAFSNFKNINDNKFYNLYPLYKIFRNEKKISFSHSLVKPIPPDIF